MLFNGDTLKAGGGFASCMLANGLADAQNAEEWTFWLDLLIKVASLILAAFLGKKIGEKR